MTAASTLNLTPGAWDIDTAHTVIGFSVRHMMVSKVKGTFKTFSGSINIADQVEDSSVAVTIDVPSVDTGNEQRDGHLRTADFFDIANHNSIKFTSTSIKPKGDDWVVTGDLAINGISKSVELKTEFGGVAGETAGFEASTEILRSDFGIKFQIPMEDGGVVVGDKVTITLDVEAHPAKVDANA